MYVCVCAWFVCVCVSVCVCVCVCVCVVRRALTRPSHPHAHAHLNPPHPYTLLCRRSHCSLGYHPFLQPQLVLREREGGGSGGQARQQQTNTHQHRMRTHQHGGLPALLPRLQWGGYHVFLGRKYHDMRCTVHLICISSVQSGIPHTRPTDTRGSLCIPREKGR